MIDETLLLRCLDAATLSGVSACTDDPDVRRLMGETRLVTADELLMLADSVGAGSPESYTALVRGAAVLVLVSLEADTALAERVILEFFQTR